MNDPGWGRGGDGKEPPRRPGKSDGPPDLDEVWRDFNNRLSSLFGRKPRRGGGNFGGGGGGSSFKLPKGSPKMVGVGLAIIIVLWLASGFLIVQEGQVAVVTRFGKYTKTLAPGLQWRWPYPIETDQIVDISRLRTFEVGFRGNAGNKIGPEALMLTNDENIVDVQFVVQYRLMPNGAPDYLFETSQPDESVRQAAETAMREVVGKQPMDHILYSGRAEVAVEVQKRIQSILDDYKTGIQVSTVAIQNVQPPEQVQAAFDDAVKAGQDRERQINEGNAYANKVLPEAQGQAARMTQEAEGYRARVLGNAEGDAARFVSIQAEFAKAPDITRRRLYLSSMQEIMENTGKVLIDADSSNNMLYLPLDQIARQASKVRSSEPKAAAASVAAGASGATAGADAQNPQAGGNATPSSRSQGTPVSPRDTLSKNRFSR